MSDTTAGRRYSSDRRAKQAAQTRADVLAAATELFAGNGWSGTTVAAIARHAGVAVDTVYAGFGSKAGLLAAVKDAELGDDENAPLLDLPGDGAGRGSVVERLELAARQIAAVNERTAMIDRVWREAAVGDVQLAVTLRHHEAGRRDDLAAGLARMVDDGVDEHTVDGVWVLTSPEVYVKLRTEREWSLERYREWVADMIGRLTAPAGQSQPGRTSPLS
jgi:AcrR family transcriptional regulator